MRIQTEIIQRLDRGEEWLLTFSNNVRNRNINQVKRARQKVEEGTYGYCDDCGRKISYYELRACPHANKCSDCCSIT